MTQNKPVTFVAGGTRGDVQPYVVLAHALCQHGIAAQVAASARWRPLVEGMQVPYRELPADPVELLLQPRFHAALTISHGIGAGVRATRAYLREMQPFVAQLRHEIPRLQDESRAIVAGVASQWIAQPAVWQSIPFVWGLFQPVAPTRDFASPLSPIRVPAGLNRLSHAVVNRAMWHSWQMHGFARDGGLSRINAQPAFFAFSRQLVSPWSDTAAQHEITGWLGADRTPLPMSDAVQRFLADTTPFMVATFGTPAANEPASVYAPVIRACQQLGVRLLVQVPAHLASMHAPAGVLIVSESLDHRQVFSQASVVIHHGGAGTTHACVAAGTPMLIVPRGIDQFFWAERVYAAQLTPVLMNRQRFDVERLTDVLAQVHSEAQYRTRMRMMQHNEFRTSGIDSATQFIRRWL